MRNLQNSLPKSGGVGIERKFRADKLPRYKESLLAIARTAEFLGQLDFSIQVDQLNCFYDRTTKLHGIRTTIEMLKGFHYESIRHATNLPFEPSTPIWTSRFSNHHAAKAMRGMPKAISSLLPGLRSQNVLEVRMTISLLKCYESIKLSPKEDISSIINTSKGIDGYHAIGKEFRKFLAVDRHWRTIKIQFNKELKSFIKDSEKVEFHYTTKKGINGPSAGTAGLQSLAINGKMLENITSLSKIFYQEDYGKIIKINQDYYRGRGTDISGIPSNPDLLSRSVGRLAFVSDKAGKTRTVAIGNYWIQNALFPFHRVSFNCLRNVDSDGTFDQISQFERVLKSSSERPVWSFDLTTATDRIPLILDIDVAKSLDKRIGILVGEILTDYPFDYRGKQIKYTVGQPMGLYGSWALLALGHHAMIRYCAWKVKTPKFTNYAIIGDDVSIWDERVAKEYMKLLDILDVPISQKKSLVPLRNEGPCVAEFAKRVSFKGIEITGISPDIAVESWKNYWLFPEFMSWLAVHNFDAVSSSPLLKAIKLMDLKPHQVSNFLCTIHINGLLGLPKVNDQGINQTLPEGIKDLDLKSLLSLRLDLLMNRTSSVNSYIAFSKVEDERVVFKKHRLENSPDDIVFKRIVKSSFDRYKELERKLETRPKPKPPNLFNLDFEDEAESETLKRNLEWYNPFENPPLQPEDETLDLIQKIRTIEYLPPVDINDLVSGLTAHNKTYVNRARYIKDLVRYGKMLGRMSDVDRFLMSVGNEHLLTTRQESNNLIFNIFNFDEDENNFPEAVFED